jgi:hypothetical protein
MLALLIATCLRLQAQDTSCFDISKISLSGSIAKQISLSYIDRHASLPEKYGSLAFDKPVPKGFIPNELVTKEAVIRFHLCNHADTAVSLWFFPGLYCRNIQLYTVDGSQVTPFRPSNLRYLIASRTGRSSWALMIQ